MLLLVVGSMSIVGTISAPVAHALAPPPRSATPGATTGSTTSNSGSTTANPVSTTPAMTPPAPPYTTGVVVSVNGFTSSGGGSGTVSGGTTCTSYSTGPTDCTGNGSTGSNSSGNTNPMPCSGTASGCASGNTGYSETCSTGSSSGDTTNCVTPDQGSGFVPCSTNCGYSSGTNSLSDPTIYYSITMNDTTPGVLIECIVTFSIDDSVAIYSVYPGRSFEMSALGGQLFSGYCYAQNVNTGQRSSSVPLGVGD